MLRVCREVWEAASRGVGLAPVLEPIVSLTDGAVVGFEALARWPGLDNPRPVDVFAYAVETGCLDELDRVCTTGAVTAALDRRLPRGATLAINAEPGSPYPGGAARDLLDRARTELTVMFELTERGLLTHPKTLLAKIAAIRDDGFAIALDDVGAHPDSLALLDIVAPDVIKLDLRLVQSQPGSDQARILAAVWAHHERTGAHILAEGIENDEHLEHALALGATVGQGYRYRGYERRVQPTDWSPGSSPPRQSGQGSPFDLLTPNMAVRTARKGTLLAFSRHIEQQADSSSDPPMVLTALQHTQNFSDATRRRYQLLAESSPLVALFGEHLPPDLGPRIRGVPLEGADPLATEWTVVVLGAQLAVALIARERAENHGSDADRRFDFVITYDRSLVAAAAHNLLERVT